MAIPGLLEAGHVCGVLEAQVGPSVQNLLGAAGGPSQAAGLVFGEELQA
jgi:hypothetical protein